MYFFVDAEAPKPSGNFYGVRTVQPAEPAWASDLQLSATVDDLAAVAATHVPCTRNGAGNVT
jgi:hypothetical protein